MAAISTYPAALKYQIAWNAGPFTINPPAMFTGIDARVLRPWSAEAGRNYELDRNEAGLWKPALDNRDGALDPTNPSSPYSPYVIPYRQCRVVATIGVNALSVDQATAGEGTRITGNLNLWPSRGVTNGSGYPLSIIAFAGAYQGTQVYQCVMPSSATAGSVVLLVQPVPVVPGTWYSFQAQAQITSGNSLASQAAILWYDINGVALTPSGGTGATLTAGAGTWTQLTVSGQAPANAYSAWLKIQPTSNLSAATTYLLDGLQWETSATPTLWQMPGTLSQNLLPRAVATGSQSINPVTDSVANWFYPTAGTIAQASFLTAAPSGHTTAVAWTTPAGTTSASVLYAGSAPAAANAIGPVEDCVQVTAGTQYTASTYLMRTTSADTTVQVTAGWRWFDINGDLLSTSAGTAVTVTTSGWTRATSTATAPTGAVWGRPRIFISSPATTTAQNTIYAAGWQVEAAAAVTAWADPGVTKGIFRGFVEQYPQAWELSGTWGKLDLVATDGLGGIGLDLLQDPFIEEVLALNPSFFYTLNDPAGSGMVADLAAQCPPGVITQSPHGAGSLTLGASISGTTTFTGTQGPVAQFANTPSTNAQSPLTYIALPAQVTAPSWGGAPVQSFTRALAFQASAIPAAPMHLWSAMTPTTVTLNLAGIDIYLDTSGHLVIGVGWPSLELQTYATNYCDGNWHLVTVGVNVATGYPTFSIDGVATVFSTGVVTTPFAIATDVLGCFYQGSAPTINGGANAEIALAAQFPTDLTPAQITTLYNSFRTGSAGESTGARFQRVLGWIGWTGPTSIDVGSSVDMGGAQDLSGSSALDALNTITTTENGNAYVSRDGTMVFKGRADRYNRNTPTYVFGEHQQYGEWPYEDVQLPVDPIHTYNDVQVTQYTAYSQYSFYTQTQQIAYAVSPPAEAEFFDRVLQRTINVESFSEVQDCANYLLGQYQTPTMRAKGIKLNPTAMPGLFTVCLNLGIGSRVRIMRRSNLLAAPIAFDGFVERVEWGLDPRKGVTVTLECSPATRASYWVMSALNTTLAAQAASGQALATINALPDSAYNALASSLPTGYQLTFDPGTSIAETMTLAPGGIPATTPGYMTAQLTFTTNFAHTHQSGAIVCEPLPMGYTTPDTWDAFSTLGAGSAQLAEPASSGTNTITVGPFPDAAANPLGADLACGDLLWIGAGGADFEGYNTLHPNLATAGGGALPLAVGTNGSVVGLYAGLGTPLVTASGTAFQGATVWQETIGANATTPGGLLYVNKAPAKPFVTMTASLYARSITSGANPQVYVYAEYLGAAGQVLSTAQSSTVTLTGSSGAAWTRLSVSSSAPAGAVWVQIGLVLAGTSPSSAWTFQADALQLEAAATASTFGVCPQVESVAACAPGYGSVVVTLAQNLANSHTAGEVVCDPLPPGTTVPSAIAGTTRLAY